MKNFFLFLYIFFCFTLDMCFAVEMEKKSSSTVYPNWEKFLYANTLANTLSPIEWPNKCIEKNDAFCLVKTNNKEKHLWSSTFGQINLNENTIVRRNGIHWQIIKGSVLIEKSKNIDIASPYGDITSRSSIDDSFFIVKKTQGLRVIVMKGELELNLFGYKSPLSLKEGFQIDIGRINNKGETTVSGLTVFDWDQQIWRWLRLQSTPVQQIPQQVRDFHHNWRQAVEALSLWQGETVSRLIASEDNRKQHLEDKIRIQKSENQEIIRIFRKKSFSTEDVL